MATDDAAPRATQDARTYMLERGNALAMFDTPWAYSDRVYVVGALLTALAAAEIARDQARVALDEHRLAYTALVGERDHEQVARKAAEAAMIRANMRAHAAEARATRLAALEEAARTVRESDPLLRGIEQPELRRHLFALYATVDALNASPGEGA